MIQRISERKFKFDYVLMDSWYAVLILISYIYNYYHVICKFKIDEFKYKYYNNLLSINKIFRIEKTKHRRKSMFGCFIQMENKNYCDSNKKYINVKIVFLRKRESSEYMAILCTDVHACDFDIVKAYAYRWDIEVFLYPLTSA